MLKLLVQLAKGGRTIICTVHQPRSQVFALFDQLLLLSRGRVVYQGPAVDADAYFKKHGYVCPAHFNPADFLLDILTETRASELGGKADYGSRKVAPAPLGDEEGNNDKVTTGDGPDAQPDAPPDAPAPPAADNHASMADKGRTNISGAEIERFPELFHQCDLAKRIEDQIDKELDKRSEGGMTAAPPNKITLESVKQTLSGFWLEVCVLAKRTVLNSLRNPLKAMGDVSQNIFMAFVLGAIFWQLGDSGLSDAQNRAGAIFFVAMNFAFMQHVLCDDDTRPGESAAQPGHGQRHSRNVRIFRGQGHRGVPLRPHPADVFLRHILLHGGSPPRLRILPEVPLHLQHHRVRLVCPHGLRRRCLALA
mmetsp:Transcript_34529/g.99420  ORF Transcript_34529/g.99420 Transcript_34529/m.99420 type:complete len:365 (+) Transcript_34529:376-1470(+)